MNEPQRALAVLPHEGDQWLCRVRGREVEPLAKAPGMPDATYVFAPDASTLAVLDTGSKRAGAFRIVDAAPWFERLLSFSTLPKSCIGHAIAMIGDTLIVGGGSRGSEALWTRSTPGDRPWRSIPLPPEIQRWGKAIDGLLWDGVRLIAIDNFVLPKWVLVYVMDPAGELRQVEQIELETHTTYERVYASSWGAPGPALLSRGINHGVARVCLSILDPDTLREAGLWSAHASREDDELLTPVDRALFAATDVAFVDEQILVACGERGLLRADLRKWDGEKDTLPPLVPARVPKLHRVNRIAVPTPSDGTGAFLVGSDPADETAAFVWVGTK